MSNKNQGDVTKVMTGTVKFMVAPPGTTLPDLSTSPVVWPVGWRNPGYTEDGLTLGVAPSTVDIQVDEEADPIQVLLDKNKTTVAAKLSQATMDNLGLAIGGSQLTTQAADATHVGTSTLDIGADGAQLTEWMVGFEGLSAVDKTMFRVAIATRAIVKGNVQLAYKRNGKHIIPTDFTCLFDSATGRALRIVEMTAVKTA